MSSARGSRPAEADQGQVLTYRGVRALVVGGTGFIGRWTARALSGSGAALFVLARDAAACRAIGEQYGFRGEIREADLRDEGQLRRLVAEVHPSITFNLAGYGVDPDERDEASAWAVNWDVVRTLAEAVAAVRDAQWPGQELVHVGSALEYGTASGDLCEDTEPRPTTVYGRSKLAGTQALASVCERAGLRGVTARLFTVYGPGEHAGRLLPVLLQAARTDGPVLLTGGRQRRDFTYVEDVAEGLLRLGCSGGAPGEIVNLATARLLSVREFVEQGAQILHIHGTRLRFGALPTRAEEMEHEPVNIERLRNRTGWAPTTGVAEGIRRTVQFEAAGGASQGVGR